MNTFSYPKIVQEKKKKKVTQKYMMRDRPGITIYKFVSPTSISACGVSRVRAEIQVSKRELHTHIYLD